VDLISLRLLKSIVSLKQEVIKLKIEKGNDLKLFFTILHNFFHDLY